MNTPKVYVTSTGSAYHAVKTCPSLQRVRFDNLFVVAVGLAERVGCVKCRRCSK